MAEVTPASAAPLPTELEYVQYSHDLEEKYLPSIRSLISRDLSEPYSIYVYRYFLYQWAHLCFMVSDTFPKHLCLACDFYLFIYSLRPRCGGGGKARAFRAEQPRFGSNQSLIRSCQSLGSRSEGLITRWRHHLQTRSPCFSLASYPPRVYSHACRCIGIPRARYRDDAGEEGDSRDDDAQRPRNRLGDRGNECPSHVPVRASGLPPIEEASPLLPQRQQRLPASLAVAVDRR